MQVSIDQDGLRHYVYGCKRDTEQEKLVCILKKSKMKRAERTGDGYLASLFENCSKGIDDSFEKEKKQELEEGMYGIPTVKELDKSKDRAISGCFSPRGRPYVPLGGKVEGSEIPKHTKIVEELLQAHQREMMENPALYLNFLSTDPKTKHKLVKQQTRRIKQSKGRKKTRKNVVVVVVEEEENKPTQNKEKPMLQDDDQDERIVYMPKKKMKPQEQSFPREEIVRCETRIKEMKTGAKDWIDYLQDTQEPSVNMVKVVNFLDPSVDPKPMEELLLKDEQTTTCDKKINTELEELLEDIDFAARKTQHGGDGDNDSVTSSIAGDHDDSYYSGHHNKRQDKNAVALAAKYLANRKPIDTVGFLKSKFQVFEDEHNLKKKEKVQPFRQNTNNISKLRVRMLTKKLSPSQIKVTSPSFHIVSSSVENANQQRIIEENKQKVLNELKQTFEIMRQNKKKKLETNLLQRRLDRIDILRDPKEFAKVSNKTFHKFEKKLDGMPRRPQTTKRDNTTNQKRNGRKLTANKLAGSLLLLQRDSVRDKKKPTTKQKDVWKTPDKRETQNQTAYNDTIIFVTGTFKNQEISVALQIFLKHLKFHLRKSRQVKEKALKKTVQNLPKNCLAHEQTRIVLKHLWSVSTNNTQKKL